jgi:hypothetical protein
VLSCPGILSAQDSRPAGLLAATGLRWCSAMRAVNRMESFNAKIPQKGAPKPPKARVAPVKSEQSTVTCADRSKAHSKQARLSPSSRRAE